MLRMQRYIMGRTLQTLLIIIGGLVVLALIAQGLSRTDLIVENQQSAFTYLKVVVLGAPQVVTLLLPLALFFASVWTLNRIHRDSEIVVVQAVGMTSWQVASPILRLAVLAALVQLTVNLWAQPLAQRELRETLTEARTTIAASLIRAGQFTSNDGALTFYARDSANGVFTDLLISDASDPSNQIDYIARTGRIGELDGAPAIIMRDGEILELDSDGALTELDFVSYAFDLSGFTSVDTDVFLKASDRTLDGLLFPDERHFFDVANKGRFLAEAHSRLASPLLNISMALLALSAIFGGDFNRNGYSRRILIATSGALVLTTLQLGAAGAATDGPALNALQWAIPIGSALAIAATGWTRRHSASRKRRRANRARSIGSEVRA